MCNIVCLNKEGCLTIKNKDKSLKEISNVKDMIIIRKNNILIYVNEKKYIEYLDLKTLKFVNNKENTIQFKSKFETDLFYLKKNNIKINIIRKFTNEKLFYILSTHKDLLVFNVSSGKLLFK